jgi:hypothetical protein
MASNHWKTTYGGCWTRKTAANRPPYSACNCCKDGVRLRPKHIHRADQERLAGDLVVVPQAGELCPFGLDVDAQTHASLNLVGKVVVQSDLLDHGLNRLNVFDGLLATFQQFREHQSRQFVANGT